MAEPAFLERDGTPIAYRLRPGKGPTIVFLPGYGSDMAGTKALALDAWSAKRGRALLRLDYAGCGASGGAFAQGTLARWRDDAIAVIDAVAAGPLLLVGSSLGGWLMLLIALARPARVAGLVGIAAAPDFTEWDFDAARRAALARDGILREPSPYSDQPTIFTRAFWTAARPTCCSARRSRSTARCGCFTARPTATSRAKSRCASPRACVQPTCRRSWSRTATTACRARRTSPC